MSRFELTTAIAAAPARCFDAARDIGLHLDSMASTGERVIAGRSSGLIGLGEDVTFRGRHFGVYHEHHSRITAFDPPRHFRDSMARGRFRRFEHDHYFEPTGSGTVMHDVIDYEVPWGILGRLADRLFVRRHLVALIRERATTIKAAAEKVETPPPS